MSRKTLALPLLIGLTALTGCSSSSPKFSNGSPQIVASPDKVSAMLAESADRASLALENLAAVERAKTPASTGSPIANVPTELNRAMTVNWVGPIEPITKTLADRAGYGFKVMGSKPSVDVIVSVDSENARIVDIMRDIGLQLGMRGDVKVDAKNKMVEIHYAPNAGLGG